MKNKTEFPLTRYNPGKLPDPPAHLNTKASEWFYKIAAWSKVRCDMVQMDIDTLEDVSLLMARYEALEDESSREIALMNVNYRLADCGFCSVDLEHLNIPLHKTFREYRQRKG